ncbi:universal stress protein [Cohnella sp. WQ 127256]|uniref:universal stress protein n=1 Tax=Cohnella sp. WQ 127256 TaxID=2938790 RepID=UPI00211990FA|nr:universal stress protein [Cohnella sp. WQ 127256]
MRQNIIVPFDGSNSAQEALRVAIEMAGKFNEAILLLNVQPSLNTPNSKRFFSDSDIQAYQQSLYEEAIAPGLHILESSGIKFNAKMRVGIPKEEICNEALNQNVRYIIIGSRGYSAFVGSMLGSVSQGILHLADCPVMVVNAPQQ